MADPTSSPPPAPPLDRERLQRALVKVRAALLAERGPHGHWEGELSSSALSTATAVTALELWQRHARPDSQSSIANSQASAIGNWSSAINAGLKWLAEHQNADGGWGDTVLSVSNISTTALCWAAFGAVPGAEARWPEVVRRAEAWLAETVLRVACCVNSSASNEVASRNTQHATRLEIPALITAIIARYGKDRTFSVPILTMCALAGRLGEGKQAWRRVIQLPFELAALPQKFFAALRLPVVSYALPALIAIGQVRHHHLPTRNPLTRLLRDRARAKTLRVLERIQPPGGGFLEATPLTSFVTMSLAGSGNADHPVALHGVEFLLKSMRADGSWPIDTNLATWVTTLAVNALGPSIHEVMSADERSRILEWLLAQQYRTVHPYTDAAPGGWAWTDLPGGVPDADDTAGALLALKLLGSSRRKEAPSECGVRNAECGMKISSTATDEKEHCDAPHAHSALHTPHSAFSVDPRVREAAIAGVQWLLDLQNRDGGIPTFCRGWTNLPFDRSSPDITAHAVRAWLAWFDEMPARLQSKIGAACFRAGDYLHGSARESDGWSPLWFGNQHATEEENRVYGTGRVVLAVTDLLKYSHISAQIHKHLWVRFRVHPLMLRWGITALRTGQSEDGGWGGMDTVLDSEAAAAKLRGTTGHQPLGTTRTGELFWRTDVKGTRPVNPSSQWPDGTGQCVLPSSVSMSGSSSSVEETSIAIEALVADLRHLGLVQSTPSGEDITTLDRSVSWLVQRVENDTWTQPAPIGFYFAKLWYYERLYPMVFTVAALEAVARLETVAAGVPPAVEPGVPPGG